MKKIRNKIIITFITDVLYYYTCIDIILIKLFLGEIILLPNFISFKLCLIPLQIYFFL